MNLVERDRQLIWHPFTQEQIAAWPIPIVRGAGSYLYDDQSKPYLDLISSWWVNLHGHAHPEIAEAISQQAKQLEHVIFAGFTHQPAVELCEGLSDLLPISLTRYFFTDNGSTAVEAALKMTYQYWWNQGEKDRQIFLSFEGGYHGDTFGAMSVGAQSGFHDPFMDLFFKVWSIPFPATWNNDSEVVEKENAALEILDQYLIKSSDQIAGLIIEPLVQGASGMRMCRPEFVRAVVERVRAYGILVIFDEVMTGFGRTGTNFALEQTGVAPDLLCLSKGLTGGFLPLALTVCTEEIYRAFLGEHFSKAFAHGHSYTANPLGCAAAIASLKLLNRDSTQKNIQQIKSCHQENFCLLEREESCFNCFRDLGTIAAFNLKPQFDLRLLTKLKVDALEQGLLIRPLGRTLYLLPPYSTKLEDLSCAYSTIKKLCKDHASSFSTNSL